MNEFLSPTREIAVHWLTAWSLVVLAVVAWQVAARPRRAGIRYAACLVATFAKLRHVVPLRRSQLKALIIVGIVLMTAAGSVRLISLAAQVAPMEQPDAELPSLTPIAIGEKIAASMSSYARGYIEVDSVSTGTSVIDKTVVRVPSRSRYATDGHRWRSEVERSEPNRIRNMLERTNVSAGFNGEVHFYFDNSANQFVLGEQSNENHDFVDRIWSSFAKRWPKSFQADAWQVVAQETVNGYRCYSLLRQTNKPGFAERESLMVSPRQDYLPVRYAYFTNDKPVYNHVMHDLAQAKSGRWYPRRTTYGLDDPTFSGEVKVTLFEPDRTFADAYFRPEIPIGSRVIDYHAGYPYVNDPWWPEIKPLLRERFNWPPAGTLWIGEIDSALQFPIDRKPAPPFDVQEWIQGGPVDLAQLRGKVVMLWFSSAGLWSGQLQEAAALRACHELYHPLGLEIVEIVGHQYTPTEARQRIRELPVPWAIAIDAKGKVYGKTFEAYEQSVESNSQLLIDHQGIVRKIPQQGFVETLAEILTAAGVQEVPEPPVGFDQPQGAATEIREELSRLVQTAPKTAKIVGQITNAKGGVSGVTVEAKLHYELNVVPEPRSRTRRGMVLTRREGKRDLLTPVRDNMPNNGAMTTSRISIPDIVTTTTTTPNGNFEFGNLTKGTFLVTLRSPGKSDMAKRVIVPEHTSVVQLDITW